VVLVQQALEVVGLLLCCALKHEGAKRLCWDALASVFESIAHQDIVVDVLDFVGECRREEEGAESSG
jgi:hypothetical protein